MKPGAGEVLTNWKSVISTPVTASLNVTLYLMLSGSVNELAVGEIDWTNGLADNNDRSSNCSRRSRVAERPFFLVRSRELRGDLRAGPLFQERNHEENVIVRAFQVRCGLLVHRADIPRGAQTERRGDGGPVRLRQSDETHRLNVFSPQEHRE